MFDEPRDALVSSAGRARRRSAIEWQADFYASCLLMPRKLVFAAWDEMFPDRKQRVLRACDADRPSLRRDRAHRRAEFGDLDCSESDDEALDSVRQAASPSSFVVSPIAMRIRLEKLGLLHREVPRQRHSCRRLVSLFF